MLVAVTPACFKSPGIGEEECKQSRTRTQCGQGRGGLIRALSLRDWAAIGISHFSGSSDDTRSFLNLFFGDLV